MFENFYHFLMTLAQDIENPILKSSCQFALGMLTWEDPESFFPNAHSIVNALTVGAIYASTDDWEILNHIVHCMEDFSTAKEVWR